jgi:hypothetical protein
MKKGLIYAAAGVAFVTFFAGSVLLGSHQDDAACATTGTANITAAAQHKSIAGYTGDQLANAAAIMNAAGAMNLSAKGQTIGVMVAMGESSLRVLDKGDVAGPDSRGLFQQRANGAWGSYQDRMDPTTSATNFFKALVKVPGWGNMTPTQAAHAVQGNQDPNHYAKFFDAAQDVVTQLATGASAACASETTVSGNAQQLAQQIVDGTNSGHIAWLTPTHFPEVQAIADGHPKADCGVDSRILKVIVVAYKTFGSIGISDVNRLCTGQRPGAGNLSAHVVNGGGHAVDFYSLSGEAIHGWEPNVVKLLKTVDATLPAGSGAGQVQCRAQHGSSVSLSHITRQFDDGCNHQHIEVDPQNPDPDAKDSGTP